MPVLDKMPTLCYPSPGGPKSPAGNPLHVSMVHEYERRILALEDQFHEAKRNIDRILRQARFRPFSLNKIAVKSQLDLINALIRLTKEESAFYAKLGQLYDTMRFNQSILKLLVRRDPALVTEFFHELDDQWDEEEEKIKDKTKWRP